MAESSTVNFQYVSMATKIANYTMPKNFLNTTKDQMISLEDSENVQMSPKDCQRSLQSLQGFSKLTQRLQTNTCKLLLLILNIPQ